MQLVGQGLKMVASERVMEAGTGVQGHNIGDRSLLSSPIGSCVERCHRQDAAGHYHAPGR